MKLADARENYYIFSGKTSDIIRQLALAGIAIVWLFRITENEATSIPQALVLPLVLIVLGLAFDLVQYAVATAVWGIYHRRKERQGVASDHEFEAPRQLNWPTITFFIMKVVAVFAAYILLFKYVAVTIGVKA